MGQRRMVGAGAILTAILFAAAIVTHWGRESLDHPKGKEPRVASVTPAGTDFVVGIGAADHLVGISNSDEWREGTMGRPKIGDYQGIDWEKLAPLKPEILITQYGNDRYPAGLVEGCHEMGIQIINVKLDVLEDIYREAGKVAAALGETEKGNAAIARLKGELEAVRLRVKGRPAVRTVVVTDDSGLALAGPGEFLDQILTIAGGENAAAGLKEAYPSVDREALLKMAPEAVIQLIPGGDKTPQVIAQAKRFWETMPELPAVKNHRVYTITNWYVLEPGLRVGDLAEQMADVLHPETRR